MTHAILDENRVIINVIEVEPEYAADFDAHYLGDAPIGIGDTYPERDYPLPLEPTETQLIEQEITALHLDQIAQGQFATELQLTMMEANANV